MSDAKPRLHTFLVLREVGKPDRIVVWDTQEVTLGRSSENDIAINQEEISRRQAIFAREEGNHVVKNMSVSNGTTVNGQEIKAAKLTHKDVIRVGEVQIQFVQSSKNPASAGLKFDYASQLKDFGGTGGGGDAESTMLGLMDPVASDEEEDDEFKVAPARDFEYDLQSIDAQSAGKARDLDLELDGMGLDDLDIAKGDPESAQPEAWNLAGDSQAPTQAAMTLRVEIAGLDPTLQQALQSLLGKVISLPPLKMRLKAD